jgi:hypothetical protein
METVSLSACVRLDPGGHVLTLTEEVPIGLEPAAKRGEKIEPVPDSPPNRFRIRDLARRTAFTTSLF